MLVTQEKELFERRIKEEENDYLSVSASHDAYQHNFGYVHSRSIKIDKKSDIPVYKQIVISVTNSNYSI